MEETLEDKKHIIAVTAVIKNKKGNKVLVIKRNKNEISYPNKWAFPGGKLEKGETLIHALRRECVEEVGIEIEDYKELLQDYTFVRPDGHNVIGFNFLVKSKLDKVTLSQEFDDFKWVSLEELKELDYIPEMEKSVELVLNT